MTKEIKIKISNIENDLFLIRNRLLEFKDRIKSIELNREDTLSSLEEYFPSSNNIFRCEDIIEEIQPIYELFDIIIKNIDDLQIQLNEVKRL